MDKRLKFAGGEIELSSDELNLMPESNQEAINGINKGLTATGQDMIASGVFAVISAGVQAVVQEGYVVLNGETLKVDAQTVPSTIGDLYQFEKVTTNPTAGIRNFRDNTTHNVYEINRAVVVNVNAITTISIDGDTLIDKLKELIRIQSDWTQADDTQPDYIKNKPNTVALLLQGKVNGIDVGSGTIPTVSGGFSTVTVLDSSGDDMRLRVNFPTIGTATYHPIVTLQSNSSDFDTDNDVKAMVKNLTASSFELLLKEDVGNGQDITAIVSIIPYT